MKSNFLLNLIFLIFIFLNHTFLFADELDVKSNNIKIYDNNKVVILTGNVQASDVLNNKVFSDYAEYDKTKGILKTTGKTKIITSEGYQVFTSDVLFDDNKKIINSDNNTQIIDKDGNKINLDMFSYIIKKNIFFSRGDIEILDIRKNNYKLSEVYIDEKKQKIVGSDVKLFLNDDSVKVNEKNQPRLFANSVEIDKKQSVLDKGVFTYCKDRGGEKCPPWQLQSKKITHNASKKTIFYDNAIVKVYDFPIFFFPKFSHPDPTVKRRSGFMVPSLSDSSTVGTGFSVPYYWAMANDRDVTFSPKFYVSENPLFLAEYRQDFLNSFLIVDAGYTSGYKKITDKKTSGSRSHLFTKLNISLLEDKNKSSNLDLSLQQVSNDTYLKIHDIDTTLANKDIDILENTLNYNYQDEDLYFGATFSAFDNMTVKGNQKYEYLVPYLSFAKNLPIEQKYGYLDFSSDLRVRNYDVNKQTELFVNDFNWSSNKRNNNLGITSQFQGLLKTVNYNAENTTKYKSEDANHEVSGALGYLAKLGLYKNDFKRLNQHLLTPKILLRYSPGHMRNIDGGRLSYSNLYEINKINKIDVVENGLSTSIGFDYQKNEMNKNGAIGPKKFALSLGQVINLEENKDMPSQTSMDQRFSDVVGESTYNINDNLNLNYTFAIDQSYKEMNYNEIGADITLSAAKFNISYLEEKNHIGTQEIMEAGLDYGLGESGQLSFSTKRNLLTNSAEFYNLSYDYINDCLKAGLVFRREFYTDRDVEPENSLMFRISLIPFADLKSPNINK